ncbi:MAG TPA: squalene synthase HpnC [Gaiellaceae bacterium]|nr:squalene synthase HpnC [Gaiellaceae bacterium]
MTAATRPVPGEAAVLERAGTENFSVAALVLGRSTRRHLLAIYGFARLVDQLGDDVDGDRLAHLGRLEEDLDRVYAGGEPEHELMRRLAPTVRALGLPRDPFRRLIDANRRDQEQSAYATYEELADYCDLSANPVGELVLHVFGAATPERIARSDDVCTALQLVEHWQDVEEDFGRGRIYLPAEDLERFGVEPGDVRSEAFRRLLAFEIERARALLDRGAPLVGTLRGRARLAVAGYVGGGRAALDALAAGSRKASKARRALATLVTFARGR